MKCRGLVTVMLILAVAALAPGCAHFVVLRDALSADEHNALGVLYETRGELTLAEAEYRKSVRLAPHMAEAWMNRGNVEAARGRWHHAEKRYRRALRESSTDADITNNLAYALCQQGRYSEARLLAQRAVATGGGQQETYEETLQEILSAEARDKK